MGQIKAIMDIAPTNLKYQTKKYTYTDYMHIIFGAKPFGDGSVIIGSVLMLKIACPSLILSLTTRYVIPMCFESLDLSLLLE